ncbi:MAG: DUF1592 domain-containing protein [Polyangiaceae bacterium]
MGTARLLALSGLGFLCACVTGEIGERSGEGSPGGETPFTPSPNDTPQAARIFRLTLRQYDHTLRDLVAHPGGASAGFIADVGTAGFANNAELLGVSTQQAAEFHQGAIEVAAGAVTDHLQDLFPCPLESLGDDACAKSFVEGFGLRAFRRPLDDDEVTRYFALYQQGRDAIDATMAVRIVVETMLQSPSFLFRSEVGDAAPGAVGKLDAFEVATALSYYLWDTMPDDELLSAAAVSTLSQAGEVEAQVERMMADPRSRDAVLSFYEQLFEYDRAALLSRDGTTFPDFQEQLGGMVDELHAFVDDVVRAQDGSLEDLLTAPHTFVDARTASLYGLAAPEGQGMVRVELDPSQRAGVLTQLGFLTIHATPVSSAPPRRGRFVVERMLCVDIPPPPDNVPAIAPPEGGGPLTTRQTFEQHATDPVCVGCHQVLDPAGFALENYDMLGRWRSEENGLSVDASTELDGLADLEGSIDGGVDLANALASSDAVRTCVVRQSLRFALGRGDVAGDQAWLDDLGGRFAGSGYRLRDLYAAIAASPRYQQRLFPE